MKRVFVALVVLIVVVFLGYYLLQVDVAQAPTSEKETAGETLNFDYSNSSADIITVQLPFPGATVSHDFTVRGEARGPWYFEASFPIFLVDAEGNELAVGIAEAQGDWMTEEFVPFAAPMLAPKEYSGPATLVLAKDNPSGLPEHDAYIAFPITISE